MKMDSDLSTSSETKNDGSLVGGDRPQVAAASGLGSNATPENELLESTAPKRGYQFWGIIAALCVTGILSSLENTVVSTSLPTIVHDLQIGDNYIWITNVFFLTGYSSSS
jgi:hypothetical protein